jgi:hypothetical protein
VISSIEVFTLDFGEARTKASTKAPRQLAPVEDEEVLEDQ